MKTAVLVCPILKTGSRSESPSKGPVRIVKRMGEQTPQSKAVHHPPITGFKRKVTETPTVKRKARVEEEDEDSEETDSGDESDQYSDVDQALAETKKSRTKARGKTKPKPRPVKMYRSSVGKKQPAQKGASPIKRPKK